MTVVTELVVYPVKSCKGISAPSAKLSPEGGYLLFAAYHIATSLPQGSRCCAVWTARATASTTQHCRKEDRYVPQLMPLIAQGNIIMNAASVASSIASACWAQELSALPTPLLPLGIVQAPSTLQCMPQTNPQKAPLSHRTPPPPLHTPAHA